MLSKGIVLHSLLVLLANAAPNKEAQLSSIVEGIPSDFKKTINSNICPLFNPELRHNDPLRIGAWNVQKLGKTKMSKIEVVQYLVQIMLRYDIIAIQEITDVTGEAPVELLQALNDYAFDIEAPVDPNDALALEPYDTYEMEISERQGRTRYKEQYAFYYRINKVAVNRTYQYPDTLDIFQFEPFSVIFDSWSTELTSFALMVIHTSPNDAPEEIDALVDVHDALVEVTGAKDVIILGDFNAGCDYVTSNDRALIRLVQQERFKWLITDHADTTTKGTSCPYDRIVISGSDIEDSIYSATAQPFYYDQEFNITNQTSITDISDHYPVELLLRANAALDGQMELRISIETKLPATTEDIFCLRNYLTSQQNTASSCTYLPKFLVNTEDILVSQFESRSVEDVMFNLNKLATEGCTFANEIEPAISHKLEHGALQDASLFGNKNFLSDLEMFIMCSYQHQECSFSFKTSTSLD